MKQFRSKNVLIFAGVALLVGCQSRPATVTPIATEPDIVTVKLAQAADKASHALDSIAGIEQYRNPSTPPREDYTDVPSNLTQVVSVRWSGPIEPIVKSLTERAGMKFEAKGVVPPVPLTVNVDAYQQPLIHILRDIGLQAGHRADLAVDTVNGVVEVRYAPGDQPEVHHVRSNEIK